MSISLTNSLPCLKYDWEGWGVNIFTPYASENGGNYQRTPTPPYWALPVERCLEPLGLRKISAYS